MVMNGMMFAAGLLYLALGAEVLVRGASQLAARFRVPSLVIGLTVVAFGTSMPEFVVTVAASAQGNSAVALGNVVGSNMFNILAILGPAAIIAPLVVRAVVVRREVPILIGVTLAFPLLLLNSRLGRLEGAILLLGLFAYVWLSLRFSRREAPEIAEEYDHLLEDESEPTTGRNIAYIVAGVVLLVGGGHLLVEAAVSMAHAMGVSGRVIGLTLVAAGTSLPELATTLIAVLRRETDIAVGNVIGSNIFNLLGIAGVASLIHPIEAPAAVLYFDLPVLALATLATFPILLSGQRVSRLEGVLLTTAFVVYVAVLIYFR